MSLFRQPQFPGTCERCGNRFDPAAGGVCPSCNKILCGEHLYGGSMVQRLRGLFGARVTCASCRARGWRTEPGKSR